MAVTNTQATAPPAEPEVTPTKRPSDGWSGRAGSQSGSPSPWGWLRFWTRSHLWLDEALSVNIARLPDRGDPRGAPPRRASAALLRALHGWMSVFGESDRAVRALLGVFAVAALPLMWLAGKRLGGRTAWGSRSVLLALNPWTLRYATEPRMYSLVVALVLAGYLLVTKALEDDGVWWLVGIVAVTATLLLTHYWALYSSRRRWCFWRCGCVARHAAGGLRVVVADPRSGASRSSRGFPRSLTRRLTPALRGRSPCGPRRS